MSAPVWSQVDAGVALALGAILETAAVYSHEQGLTPRVLSHEEIFPAATLSL